MVAGAVALGVALAVAGCTSSPVGSKVTEAPTHAASAAAPTAHAVSTPPPTPTTNGATPVKADCATLVPASVAKGVAPGYVAIPAWKPSESSPLAHLAALDGTVCAWKDAKTGHVLEVGVARPSADDDLALKNDLVERSNSVPTYREEAYFQVTSGVGEVNDFHGSFWTVASSEDLYEPGDAAGLIASVDRALDALG